MELILLRHGKAEDFHPDGDFSRRLLEKGVMQSRRAALLLQACDRLPDIILTSPLARAVETAFAFCEVSKCPRVIQQDWLACGMHPETAMSELRNYPEIKRVMIVGHEPDFSEFVEWSLGCKGGGIQFKKAALASLSISPPSRYGILNFLIPPRLILGI